MEFRSTFPLSPSMHKIDHQSPILGIGSCFIENIGGLLQQYKFPTLLNPFGIIYNPISIDTCLTRLLQNKPYEVSELIENQGIWYSFDHHGQYSGTNSLDTLALINQSYLQAVDFLKNTKWLFLTFGTATIYIHQESRKIVANCHKIPNKHFKKHRLSVSQIVEPLARTLGKLQDKNKELKVVLTVSPIRHIKDGIIENQRSKATLLLAAEQLSDRLEHTYFPSYEIMMDDLRDYRFYEKDLIHPNSQAIAYIWDAFEKTFFLDSTKDLKNSIKKIVQASQHRPFHPNTVQHQQFLQKHLQLIELLEKRHPYLSFEKEKSYFKSAN